MVAPDDGSGDSVRGLILQLRGRLGMTQRELAARLDVHPHSVQAWEAGSSYPSAARLQALIAVALQAGGFTPGHEAPEAAALWSAVMRESTRLRMPFDRGWFDSLTRPAPNPSGPAAEAASGPTPITSATTSGEVTTRRHAWGEAPDVTSFVGRTEECQQLRTWVLDDQCRVAAVYGFGGIGKTLLAAWLARDVAPHFEYIYWRSLRDAPSFNEWLAAALAFLAPEDPRISGGAAQMARLLELLSRSRCLLILDNFETVLTGDTDESRGADVRGSSGHDDYASLLRRLGETPHRSCLLLTSREAPATLSILHGDQSPVRSLHLSGFEVEDGRGLLLDKGLDGHADDWRALVSGCGGNGLALKVTAETIRDLFGGSISSYLEYAAASPGLMLGGLRQLLAAQIARLSESERRLLSWLAVEREPVSFMDLAAELGPQLGRGATLEAIEGLRRRSLLERGERQARFTLHPVVLEYVTELLIDEIAQEIQRGDLKQLLTQPLVKATARDYVRRAQERLIATPLLDQLVAAERSAARVEQRLLGLLDELRAQRHGEQGYGPGNLVNLLRLSRGNLRQVNLSGLQIRQGFFQGVEAQDASLAGAHLTDVALADAFKYPTSVTLSADGAYLVAGSSAGEVCLWRVADRTLLDTFPGHAAGVRGVAMSQDNRLIASCSFDGTIQLWEVTTGRNLATLRGHDGLVYAIALSADGALAASGGQDGTVRLWDTRCDQMRLVLPGHVGGIWAVALSSTGDRVVSGSVDGGLRLWDARDGRLLRTFEGHTSGVLGAALSHDGVLLVSGSYDGAVRVWETNTGRLLQTFDGGAGGIRDVALSGDGRIVASGGFDAAIRIWDVGSGRLTTTLRGHRGLVYSVALSEDGAMVVSGSFDGSVKLWDTATGQTLAHLQGYNRSTRSVSLSGDGRLALSSSFEGPVRLWDTASGQLVRTLTGHATGVRDLALSADGRYAVSGSFDGAIYLWDVATGRPRLTLSGPVGGVWGLALSGDARRIAAGAYDGSLRVWSVESGQLIQTMTGHASGVRDVTLSRDGRLLVSGSEDKTVNLWDVERGRRLASFEGHTGGIWGLAFSADERLIASSSDDRTIRVWDAQTGRLVTTLLGHTDAVWGIALSDDRRRLASASFDGTVRLWDVEAGAQMACLNAHESRVTGMALSADGAVAVSCGVDGTVRVWDTETGALRHTMLADRRYERLDITGATGVTDAQRDALLALGAVDHSAAHS